MSQRYRNKPPNDVSYFGNDVKSYYSSDIHRPFSTWRFWVYYEVNQTVIKFWIC